MLQVKRIGHATLTTPDLERQLDYYTRVVGLSTVAKEKNRAILATKPGQEAIVLEHGERPAGVRLAFQVAPGSDLGDLSARLSKTGITSERRSSITPGLAQRFLRLPALQPRPPHDQSAASRQRQYSPPRVRAARRSRDQPRLRLPRAQEHQVVLGSDPPPHRTQHRDLSQEPRRHHGRV